MPHVIDNHLRDLWKDDDHQRAHDCASHHPRGHPGIAADIGKYAENSLHRKTDSIARARAESNLRLVILPEGRDPARSLKSVSMWERAGARPSVITSRGPPRERFLLYDLLPVFAGNRRTTNKPK